MSAPHRARIRRPVQLALLLSSLVLLSALAALRFAPTRSTGGGARPRGVPPAEALLDAKAAVDRLITERPHQRFHPSPARWSDEVFYLIMPDRFDRAAPTPARSLGPPSLTYNGGDLKGIQRRLDYLRELGVTALLLTPIFETLPDRAPGVYHGYCLRDPTRLNPRFGDDNDLRELVTAAHERGLRVVLDIVINHVCHEALRYGSHFRSAGAGAVPATPEAAATCAEGLLERSLGGAGGEGPRRDLLNVSALPAGFADPALFSRCGRVPRDTVGGRLFGDFDAQMFDLDSTNLELAELLGYHYSYWLALADVDGFRFDAAAHVNELYAGTIAQVLRETGRRMGKDNLYLVGEVADAARVQRGYLLDLERKDALYDDVSPRPPIDPAVISAFKRRQAARIASAGGIAGLNAIYDFEYSGNLRDFFLDSPEMFQNPFHGQLAPGGRPHHFRLKNQPDLPLQQFLTQVDSHDWPRVFGRMPEHRARQALAVLFTGPGIPILTYGTEQGFSGRCDLPPGGADPRCHIAPESARQAMFTAAPYRLGSVVPSVDRLKGIGTLGPPGETYFQTDHELFQFVQALIRARKEHIAPHLGTGSGYELHLLADSSRDVLAFFAGPEVVTLVNRSDRAVELRSCGHGGARAITLRGAVGAPGDVIRVDPEASVILDHNGGCTVPPRHVGVYLAGG